ncbi:hypothetical protein [Aquamicrobium ahrensii]|uniref:Uncharacterized protein n=1 Tax=Aquamicrobium ahrensii TaxID=469551 RepID=A0ABV2KN50_9HYPH
MNSLIYNTGTVSVSGGLSIVEGNLTGWAVALVEGGVFSCDGLSIPILSVEDDTHLTLAYAWPGANGSGKQYAIARTSSEATARAATWTVDRLGKLAQTPWGVGVVPDGRGTLAQRDALSPMPNDDYCWLRVEVDEPAELYFREGGVWLGPYELRGEPGADSAIPSPAGSKGWTPVIAVVADGARYVQQVIDWTGGNGGKPAAGQYVGSSGFVETIEDAANIRGASGDGTGDMLAEVYDPSNKAADAFSMRNMAEDGDAKIMTAAERVAIAGLPDALASKIGRDEPPVANSFNLLKDAGRFAGSPEPQGARVTSFAAPAYIQPANGATVSAGPKHIYDNTTYGGSFGDLDADVDALISKLKDASYRRYGVEFYLMQITAGAGTGTARTINGVSHYLPFAIPQLPLPPELTINYHVLVKSGSLGCGIPATPNWLYLDGQHYTGAQQILPADGWRQVTRRVAYDPRQFNGYDNLIHQLFATPGAVFYLAALTVTPGLLPMGEGRYYGVVPSLEAWR